MNEVIVRNSLPEDAEGTIAHMIGIACEPDAYVSYTPDEANVAVAKESESIGRLRQDGDLVLIAEADERIIAQLRCSIDRRYAITRHTAVLGMSVDRDYRNRGVGSSLLERAIEWAHSSGIVRLELEVYVENAPALHLYQKFGFEIEGRKKMYAYQRGRYFDSYLMSRLFD